MSEEITQAINITIGSIGLVIGILAVLSSHSFSDENTKHWNALRDLRKIWVLSMIALTMDILSNVSAGHTTLIALCLKSFIEFSAYVINYTMLVLFSEAIIRGIGDAPNDSVWMKFCNVIGMIYIAFLLSSFVTHSIYWIDAQNIYHRGHLFFIPWVLSAIVEFGNFYMMWRRWRDMDRGVLLSYLLLSTITTAATLLQMLIYGISLVYMALILSIVCIFFVSQRQMYEQLLIQERELTENKMQTMISKLHPHFLYNALTAIMAIEGTPQATKNAIHDFAGYLRGNLDSLNHQDLIDFEQELRHIKTYVNLEMLRFGDKLHVEYDIETVNFKVPPLSVQMIVENAIKHGLYPKNGRGFVFIRVSEKMGYYEIRVTDNGIGFNRRLEFVNTRSHVGLENTSYRLEKLLNGKLKIESVIGKGTTITIIIPMEDM